VLWFLRIPKDYRGFARVIANDSSSLRRYEVYARRQAAVLHFSNTPVGVVAINERGDVCAELQRILGLRSLCTPLLRGEKIYDCLI
jgi:hypothetical protein